MQPGAATQLPGRGCWSLTIINMMAIANQRMPRAELATASFLLLYTMWLAGACALGLQSPKLPASGLAATTLWIDTGLGTRLRIQRWFRWASRAWELYFLVMAAAWVVVQASQAVALALAWIHACD